MCRLHTEGVQFGCGHYIVTDHLSKDDCCDQFCMNSDLHPERRCAGCGETCKRYYDPDATQSVTDNTPAYCTLCDYWFKGAGAKREVNPVALAGADVLRNTRPQPKLPNSVPAEVLLNTRPQPQLPNSVPAEVLLNTRPQSKLPSSVPAGAEVLLNVRSSNSVSAGAEVLLNVRSSNSASAGGAVPLKQHPQPQRRQIRQR